LFDPSSQNPNPQFLTNILTDVLSFVPLRSWQPSTETPIVHRRDLRKTVQVSPLPVIVEGSGNDVPAYYGTRLSTVLLVRKDGNVLFIERDIWVLVNGKPERPDPPTERRIRFKLDVKFSAGTE